MGQCFLGQGEHLIGREAHCTIQLEASYVSREHARLIISADAIEIEDLDSTSGTYLDGVIVKGRIPIQPGQKLWISELYIDIERQGFGGLVEGSRLGNGGITLSGQWYYTEDGAQYGPVDEAVIVRLIRDGELPTGTPVLQEGSTDWQPARNHACFQVEIFPRKKREPTQPAPSNPLDEEKYYEHVAAELQGRNRKQGMWLMAETKAGDDAAKARSLYTEWRVEQLLEEEAKLLSEGKKAPVMAQAKPVSKTEAKKPGAVLWEFETGNNVYSSSAIGSDGTVYVGSHDNKLYAIKTESLGPAKSPWPMRGQNALHTGRLR